MNFTQAEKDALVTFYVQRCEQPPQVGAYHIGWSDWGYAWTVWKRKDGRIALTQDGDEPYYEDPEDVPVSETHETVEAFCAFIEQCESVEHAIDAEAFLLLVSR